MIVICGLILGVLNVLSGASYPARISARAKLALVVPLGVAAGGTLCYAVVAYAHAHPYLGSVLFATVVWVVCCLLGSYLGVQLAGLLGIAEYDD